MMDQAEHISHNGATTLELIDFVITNYPAYKGKERKIEKVIRKSLDFGTADYGLDNEGIIYVLRYNIDPDGREADVIDLMIRQDLRGTVRLLKYIIARNWTKFPSLERIKFHRLMKYPYRGKHRYKLIKLFNKGVTRGG